MALPLKRAPFLTIRNPRLESAKLVLRRKRCRSELYKVCSCHGNWWLDATAPTGERSFVSLKPVVFAVGSPSKLTDEQTLC